MVNAGPWAEAGLGDLAKAPQGCGLVQGAEVVPGIPLERKQGTSSGSGKHSRAFTAEYFIFGYLSHDL